jgi:putative ABC transport system substrate-binding protein
MDLKLLTQTIANTSNAAQASAKLASEVDAIFISNDNTALAALQTIIANANKAGIPVYVSDTDAVKLGAKAALGPDQYEVGLQTAKMIARVLNGEDINVMKIEFPDITNLVIGED